ncbi:discoidin domain-containing protein [Streptomyces sp. NBC_01198]|uniref:discoidin domain-containing protein n=1 Tax=Streptomyces sp. NBC_01198 TaxID=2903769 RepID=UPI002E12C47A|nr:discoidin domain-containing protein [Streptomyces sp. NBC_01198]
MSAALAALAGLIWISVAPASAAPHASAVPRAAAASAAAGAATPFAIYEGEAGTLGGGASTVSLTSAPTTQFSSAPLEASGHAYAHLAGTGQSVQWTNTTGHPISFVNVRASIPDSAAGGGLTGTLDLYVNGTFRQALNLNSKQTWVYEGNNNYNTSDNQNPSDGSPRVFFDESHAFVTGDPIAAGSTFALKKDAANSASSYDIDSVDVENPPAPIAQPANSISLTSCGAVSDSTPTNGSADSQAVDSSAAIQNCINQAQSQSKTLWIPPGTFYVKGTAGLHATGITIAGAGMWYSTIYRDVPVPNNTPLAALFSVTSCTVKDFHIDANAVSRSTIGGDGGAMDTTGTNWVADGIWTQHTMSGFWASGTGGKVQNSRLTSIWADGINLNNVSLGADTGNNLTATNNFVRGTGDDAMAINSVNYNTDGGTTTYYHPMTAVTFTGNTAIAPWGGKGIGIYGGSGHLVSNNYISDTARYIGLGAGRFGVNGSDLLSAAVTGNVVVRSGGNAYSQGQPALHVGNGGDGQNTGVVDHVTVTGNTVADSVYDAVGFSTSTNTLLQNNTITNPGRNGVVISPPFYPAPSGSATISGNTLTGLHAGNVAYANNSAGFSATLSGNSWQTSTPPAGGPYGGTPAAVPGTVQAENYDTGGQGSAYNVTSVNGNGTAYRGDGVNLEATSDSGGGYDLGWTGSGQWFRYTVDVASAGTYTVGLRAAAPAAVSGALHLSNASGANLSGAVALPATGDWQSWATVTTSVTLPAGRQVLTVNQDNGGWNLNQLAFTASTGTTPATDLAAGRPAGESSHTQTYSASNVTDADRSSYWESANNAFPQWVQVDLGSAQSVSRVVLRLPAGWGARTQTVSLQGSTDGSAFGTLKASATYTFDPAADNTVTVTFPATTERYVRVTVTANSGWPAGQLSEVQVWKA